MGTCFSTGYEEEPSHVLQGIPVSVPTAHVVAESPTKAILNSKYSSATSPSAIKNPSSVVAMTKDVKDLRKTAHVVAESPDKAILNSKYSSATSPSAIKNPSSVVAMTKDVKDLRITAHVVAESPFKAILNSKYSSATSPPAIKNPSSVVAMTKDVKDLRKSSGYSNLHIFTYEEMQTATKLFRPDQVLGEGGFGIVYKGVIDENMRPGYKRTHVAIKELDPEGIQGEREWLAEVNYLGQLHHPNLVKLIGYCCEEEHRLLVYEYMASGSLEKHLFRRVSGTLNWSRRMKIALDAAKGLAFLHDAERPVIYRDFKTSNILLDADFKAKLSDFGLAKDGPMGDQTHVSTRIMGTYGYAAPEYVMTGHLTARSDIYGFGVVLLEMLIGQRAMDTSRPSREHNLAEWARPLLNHSKKLFRILDPRMEGQYSSRTALKVANLAYQCLSPNPKGRPLMGQVVEILESLQTEDWGSREDGTVPGEAGIVTLYEVPGANNIISGGEKKGSDRGSESGRGGEGGVESESEPTKDGDIYIPSADRVFL